MDKPLREEQIVIVAGIYMRDSIFVAIHFDRSVQSREANFTGGGRIRASDQMHSEHANRQKNDNEDNNQTAKKTHDLFEPLIIYRFASVASLRLLHLLRPSYFCDSCKQ